MGDKLLSPAGITLSITDAAVAKSKSGGGILVGMAYWHACKVK